MASEGIFCDNYFNFITAEELKFVMENYYVPIILKNKCYKKLCDIQKLEGGNFAVIDDGFGKIIVEKIDQVLRPKSQNRLFEVRNSRIVNILKKRTKKHKIKCSENNCQRRNQKNGKILSKSIFLYILPMILSRDSAVNGLVAVFISQNLPKIYICYGE